MARDAVNKVFAGPRLRRLRRDLGLNQAQMAQGLEISPSYLNLLERNQRPLSAQLLLKLADTYDVNLKGLTGDEGGHIVAAGTPRDVVKVKESRTARYLRQLARD